VRTFETLSFGALTRFAPAHDNFRISSSGEPLMNARRIIAAAVSVVALLAVNVGAADSAAAKTSAWNTGGHAQTATSAWD
jgi:hypothetical protein